MLSHFILALSLLAIFIECRSEKDNKKLKAAIKDNSDEYDLTGGTYEHFISQESVEIKVQVNLCQKIFFL